MRLLPPGPDLAARVHRLVAREVAADRRVGLDDRDVPGFGEGDMSLEATGLAVSVTIAGSAASQIIWATGLSLSGVSPRVRDFSFSKGSRIWIRGCGLRRWRWLSGMYGVTRCRHCGGR